MIPAPFDYVAPPSLAEAVDALAAHGEGTRILAGGQSLLPMMKLRLARPRVLIDISKIPELAGIRQEGDQIILGALTTHYQIESSALLQEKCPLLPQTARMIGDVQVRNRGTIGGSLAHADPAADLPAAVLALRGEVELRSAQGERWVGADGFFLDIMTTALRPVEVLTRVRVPVLSGRCGTAYLKVRQKASGFAIVGVAAWLKLDESQVCEDIGVGMTGVQAVPSRLLGVEARVRGRRVERTLIEQAAAGVTKGVEPFADIHASADFRAHLARLYAAKAIQEAMRSAARAVL